MHEHDYIAQFSVKIEYKFQGTGVLIKSNDDYYVITAKHNFKQEECEDYDDVEIDKLSENLAAINITYNGEKIGDVSNIVFDKNDLDIIVFSMKNLTASVCKIDSITILKNDHSSNGKYFFYGYPNDKSGRAISLNYDSKVDDNEFRLTGDKSLKNNVLKGFSGSGLFIKYESRCYLVGIVIKAYNGLFDYKSISLSALIDEINVCISEFSENPIKNKKVFYNRKEKKDKAMKKKISNAPVFNIGNNNHSPINTGSGYQNITINTSSNERKPSIDDAMELFQLRKYKKAKKIFFHFIGDDENKIYYIISSLSKKNIAKMRENEVDKLYDLLDSINSEEYYKLSNYLWLIIFLEHTNTYLYSKKFDDKYKERMRFAITNRLNSEEKYICSDIVTFNKKSKFL